ncbi:hypothetical protein [Mucilaginibacter dorajii]|uniref:hypothetical protein n=1 Tax=Mucilaginibacter dorajii TaxID=692994 RepID=UPI00216A4FC7|nr:hypothetical protein [Mucilaginibacter dorajii]MCS3736099.1 hypothetical protein [Mucilaginibacter dorajii]
MTFQSNGALTAYFSVVNPNIKTGCFYHKNRYLHPENIMSTKNQVVRKAVNWKEAFGGFIANTLNSVPPERVEHMERFGTHWR